MAVSKEEFRQALSRFASGVTVVTCKGGPSGLGGITVSAFSSLSLDPPLVLICIDKRASVHDYLRKGDYFAVNFLAEGQEAMSRQFASKEPNRFDGVSYREGNCGTPLLEGTIGFVECLIVESHIGGDHTIFIGQVEASGVNEGKPLLYFCGGYKALEDRSRNQ